MSNSFKIQPEGTVIVSKNEDGSLGLSSDKSISTDLGSIESFGIENVAAVIAYEITNVDGVVKHHVKFRNGGTLDLSFNEDGTNFSASAHNLISSVTQGNKVLIGTKK